MRQALALDPQAELRQLLIADAKGEVAAFTGGSVGPWAGDLTGDGFAVAGNLLVGNEVISKMAAAFSKSTGRLADRLLIALACLAAGVAIGGLNDQPVRLDLGFTILPTTLGVAVIGCIPSPIPGGKGGNREHLALLRPERA